MKDNKSDESRNFQMRVKDICPGGDLISISDVTHKETTLQLEVNMEQSQYKDDSILHSRNNGITALRQDSEDHIVCYLRPLSPFRRMLAVAHT
jgi:hypothetical protein